jgi:hypothetical protein
MSATLDFVPDGEKAIKDLADGLNLESVYVLAAKNTALTVLNFKITLAEGDPLESAALKELIEQIQTIDHAEPQRGNSMLWRWVERELGS